MSSDAHFLRRHRVPLLLLCLVPSVVNVVRFSRHIGQWWTSVHYFVGYDTGFGGRKLLGSLCGWLFPDYVEGWMVGALVLVANLLMLLLFVAFAGRAVPEFSRDTLPVWMASVVYLLGPFSLVQYCNRGLSSGFMETWQLMLTLVWLLLFLRHRGRWWFFPLTLLLAAACCLIHHAFCCSLFPLWVALFAYDVLEEGFPLPRVLAYGGVCVAMLLLFVAIWYGGRMNVDLDTLREQVARRAAPDACGADREALRQYYYAARENNVQNLQVLRLADWLLSLVLLSPLFAVGYWPWVAAARRTRAVRYWMVPMVLTLLLVPVFFRTTDYSRWWVCWFFSLWALLMVAAHDNDRPVQDALSRMWGFFRRHWYLGVALAVYVVQLYQCGYEGLEQAIVLRQLLLGASPFDSINL